MYKKLKMILSLSLVFIISVSLSACGKAESESAKIRIGILQFAEHPALDDARIGFEDELKDLGIDVELVYQNSQGDIPKSISMAQKFVRDEVDLIYAIGTPAAQSAKQVTDNIPILFSAVTDPVTSKLVDSWDRVNTNITGTSDRADIKSQLSIFNELDKDIKDIGIIYNTSEVNSKVQVEEAESIAKELGLNIISVGINNINDINKGLASLLNKVDAMYIISDNLIASSVDLVANKLIEENMISVSAEESQVAGGILITKSHSYYDLGRQTGNIAKEILIDGKKIESLPVYLAEKINLVVNEETLSKLDIDKDIEILNKATKVNN